MSAGLRIAGLLCLATVLLGCGDDAPEISYPERKVNEPPAESCGRLVGRVLLRGEAPAPRRLRSTDAWCGAQGEALYSQDLLVDGDGVKNVLCLIEGDLANWVWDYEREPAEVDQVNCRFVPHVLVARCRQPIRFLNSDATVHNVNAKGESASFLFTTPPESEPRLRQVEKPDLSIPVRCDIHPHMLMWLHIVDHPLFSLSADRGSFAIDGIPAGTYTLRLIHERLGELRKEIEIRAGETTTLAEDALVFELP